MTAGWAEDTNRSGDSRCPDRRGKLLYTPAEAATLLSLSRSKIYELMGSGRLAYVLVDRSRRVPAESLRRFVGEELQRQGFPPGTYLSDPAASLWGQGRLLGGEGS